MAELILVLIAAYLAWRFIFKRWLGGNSHERPDPPKAKQPERLSGAAWNTSDRPTAGGERSWRTVSQSETPLEGGLSVSVGAYTREYDPDKYRYDGLADPEFRIKYRDEDGSITTRDIYVHRWRRSGGVIRYECWCFLRDEKRTFRSDRMLEIVNLYTNRKIKDIAAYRERY